jgi:TonB family protein
MALNLDRKLGSTLSAPQPKGRGLALGVPDFILVEERDRRPMIWGTAIAILLHVVLLLISLPQIRQEIRTVDRPPRAYVIHQVRFKPPQVSQAQAQPVSKSKTRKVPIPDPTPDDPEPIVTEVYEAPPIEMPAIGEGDFTSLIPDAPPGPGAFGSGSALQMGGDIVPPVKVFSPQPGYTEEARQARIQGIVILQAIIDVAGNVTNVRVLKGLPEGLAEAAVETVGTWRFKPATLEGKPVPVYYNFTVNFSLQ